MRIHYLQHVPFEGPGYIRSWVEQNGRELTGTHLFGSEELPQPEAIDTLVVMGGPMSVHDDEDYSWLRKEKNFIQTCINQKKKVLGICLGAQLIADVLGAEVVTMPEKEIGWFPVNWSEAVHEHPWLDFLPSRQMVLHWHGDMFHLLAGALSLAGSSACENQGFLIDDRILGLQFHLEITREGLADLIKNSREDLSGRFIQKPDAMMKASHFAENHRTMHQLLNRFLSE